MDKTYNARMRKIENLKQKRHFPESLLQYTGYTAEYLNSISWETEIEWRCPVCGELFMRKIATAVRYMNNPFCCKSCSCRRTASISGRGSKYKLTRQEVWADRLDELREDYRVLAEEGKLGVSNAEIAVFVCPVHGEYEQRCMNHLASPCNCPYCAEENMHRIGSSVEIEISSFIESLSYSVIRNTRRVIKSPSGHNMELDIYIPEISRAIEIDGGYWHKEIYDTYEEYLSSPKNEYGYRVGKWRGYHEWKDSQCKSLGITLLHITDDEWTSSREETEQKIKEFLEQ